MDKEGTNLEDLKRAGGFPLWLPLALLYCECVQCHKHESEKSEEDEEKQDPLKEHKRKSR